MRPTYKLPSYPAKRLKRQASRGRARARGSMALGTMGLLITAGFATTYVLNAFGWLPGLDLVSFGPRGSIARAQAMIESRAGLILFTSPNEDTCREQLFDNASGSQRDNGIVDCKGALYRAKQNEMAARLNAIGDGFRQK